MRFTIVTPSFNQLDWLELCVASVKDQVATRAETGSAFAFGAANGSRLHLLTAWQAGVTRSGAAVPLTVEHIVQDAGTPGIEEFALEMGAGFWHGGQEIFRGQETRGGGYSLAIYSEKDAGMYDAINKGLRRATGEICAYLNCDEQYLPGALSAVAEWFGRNKAREVAFGDIVVVRPDGSYICDRTAMVPTNLHTLVSGNLAVYSAATFFRRESVVDRGLLFGPDWKVVGDSVWILSLLAAGLKMGLLRRRVASFIYSGENLSLDAKGTEERNRLRSKACAGARVCAPAIVALFRLRRMLRGGYSLAAQDYAIYTSVGVARRTAFQVERPTHRWPTNQMSL
jgi:glycosyltransferase involved in cell wall biosynthesis